MISQFSEVRKRRMVQASRDNISTSIQAVLDLQRSAYHLAHRILWEQFAAEDAVAESQAKAVASLKAGTHPDDTKRWYFSIVLNCAKNIRRSEQRRKRREEIVGASKDKVKTNRLQNEIREALSTLSEQERIPIAMHYELGMSQVEISKTLNISKRVINYRIGKGLDRLRLHLSDVGVGISSVVLISNLQDAPLELPSASFAPGVADDPAALDYDSPVQSSSFAGSTSAILTGLALIGGVVFWTANPIVPTPNEKNPVVEPAKANQNRTAEMDTVLHRYAFNNGIPADLKIHTGQWAAIHPEGYENFCLSFAHQHSTYVRIGRMPEGQYIRFRAKIWKQNANSRGTFFPLWMKGNKTNPYKSWSVNIQFNIQESMDGKTIEYWFYQNRMVTIYDGKVYGVVKYDQWDATDDLGFVAWGIMLEEMEISRQREEKVPVEAKSILDENFDVSVFHGSRQDVCVDLPENYIEQPAPKSLSWTFGGSDYSGFKNMSKNQLGHKFIETIDGKKFLKFRNQNLLPDVFKFPVNVSLRPLKIKIRARILDPKKKHVFGIALGFSNGTRPKSKITRLHPINLTKKIMSIESFVTPQYIIGKFEGKIFDVMQFESPYPSNQIYMIANNVLVEQIEWQDLQFDDLPEEILHPQKLLQKQ